MISDTSPTPPRKWRALTARKHGLAQDDVDVSHIDTVLQRMADSQLHLFGGLEPVPVHTDRFLLSLGAFGAPRAGSVHSEEGLQAPGSLHAFRL